MKLASPFLVKTAHFWPKYFLYHNIGPYNEPLTVDFDVALARGRAHVVGGLDLVLAGHAAGSAVDGQAVEAVRVLVGLDPVESLEFLKSALIMTYILTPLNKRPSLSAETTPRYIEHTMLYKRKRTFFARHYPSSMYFDFFVNNLCDLPDLFITIT
jgi:hypothetical protein